MAMTVMALLAESDPTRFHSGAPLPPHFEYANILFHVDWVDWDDFQRVTRRPPPTFLLGGSQGWCDVGRTQQASSGRGRDVKMHSDP